jgi:hypothetical protein
VARLTPLGHPTINLQGRRYRTTSRPPLTGLRLLRTSDLLRILHQSSSRAVPLRPRGVAPSTPGRTFSHLPG